MTTGTAQSIEELLESAAAAQEQENRKKASSDHFKKNDDYVSIRGRGAKMDWYEGGEDGQPSISQSRRLKDEDGDESMKDSDDKASANGSERSRDEKLAARSERFGPISGSRLRDGDHDDYDREDDYRSSQSYRRGGGGGRGRSRSPVDSYRPRGDHHAYAGGRRSRSRSAGRSYYPRDNRDRRDHRDRYSGGRDDRARRRPRSHSPREKKPEQTDEDLDKRTVFVQQLSLRTRVKHLKEFFSKVGTVVEATIVEDRVSHRSKGVAYVQFKEQESVDKAIALTGQKLLAIPVIVGLTEAEKNRQARTVPGAATQSNGIPFHRLYVGNIHFSVTEQDLYDVFVPFGELEFVQLQKEEMPQRSKGYGFVQFVNPADAKTALADMNGFEIAGRPIRVGLGNDKFTPETTASLLQKFQSQGQQAANKGGFQGSAFSGSGGRGSHAGGTNNFDRASGRDEKGAGGGSALDDSDVGGVNFRNVSRASLMSKLARTEDTTPVAASATARGRNDQAKQVLPTVTPSRCVVVKNAYNEAEETELNWVKELEDDFRSECAAKYGPVVHVGLFRDSQDGEIYVKFKDISGGDKALKGLNGRYFGGRTLTAQPIVDAVYNMNFPKAANA